MTIELEFEVKADIQLAVSLSRVLHCDCLNSLLQVVED